MTVLVLTGAHLANLRNLAVFVQVSVRCRVRFRFRRNAELGSANPHPPAWLGYTGKVDGSDSRAPGAPLTMKSVAAMGGVGVDMPQARQGIDCHLLPLRVSDL